MMRHKVLVSLLCLPFALIFLLLIFLPSLLSTNWVKNQVITHLEKKYQAKIGLESLHLSWFGPQQATQLLFQQNELTANVDRIEMNSSLFSLFQIRNQMEKLLFSGAIDLENGSLTIGDKLSLSQVTAQTTPDHMLKIYGQTKQGSETGEFSLLGKLALGSTWTLHILRFPSQILESFKEGYPFKEILGPTFNADVELHLSKNSMKEFSYEKIVKSQNVIIKSTGNYKNGIIELSTPLEASLILTEALSDILFKDSSLKPVSAKHIHLWIYPQGASIPISPFSWKKLSIPNLTLDLQKIECRNFGTLSDFLSVIQFFPRMNQNVDILFQNAPMSIMEGICTIERTEMLVDQRFELGFWGTLNLIKKTAQMNLGITASALQKALGLHGLPEEYTVPMKLDGPFADLHLHKTSALKIIGALVLIEKQPFLPIPGGVFLPTVDPSPPVRKPLPW